MVLVKDKILHWASYCMADYGANFVNAAHHSIDVTLSKVKSTRLSLPEAANLLYLLDIEIVGGFE